MKSHKVYTLPVEDLESIYSRLESIWPKNKTFLITGGTGFFGRWLVESICFLEKKMNHKNTFYVTTRNMSEALNKIPALSESFFILIQGDLEKSLNVDAKFNFVLHAATDVSQFKNQVLPVASNSKKATQNILDRLDLRLLDKFLYISSGGVYNKQSAEACCENDVLNLENINSYSLNKIENENIISGYFEKNKFCIARCFSFLGPYCDQKMIAMQMIDKKIKNEVFSLSTPDAIRSYMYPSDLVVDLFFLLFSETKFNIYNVGSSHGIELADFAQRLKLNIVGGHVSSESLAGKYYYPNTERIVSEFKNRMTTDLNLAIEKTLKYQIER